MVPPSTKWDRPDGGNRRAGRSDQLRQLLRSAMSFKHTEGSLLRPAGTQSRVDFAITLQERAMNSEAHSRRRIHARGLPSKGAPGSRTSRIPSEARSARTQIRGRATLAGQGAAAAGGDQ